MVNRLFLIFAVTAFWAASAGRTMNARGIAAVQNALADDFLVNDDSL